VLRARLAVVLVLSVSLVLGCAPGAGAEPDALTRRVSGELTVFTDWLARNRARGYIGEVGWPDDSRGEGDEWNSVARAWYAQADAAGLGVTSWAAGEWWGTTYPMAAYEDRAPGGGVDSADSQAAVVEAHRSGGGGFRGVNVAGGEFGAPNVAPTSSFSNANPGAYDRAYHYDTDGTFRYLASRGVKVVRLPFRWERLQPRLGQALNQTEVGRLKAVVARARRAGIGVVLDAHNYGAYYLHDGRQGVRRAIGSPQVTTAHFADLWWRLSVHFGADPGVVGYGLMNEPVQMPSLNGRPAAETWEAASNRAIASIRGRGDRKLVLVAGYDWSSTVRWPRNHPDGWVVDRADNFRYEAHHYFDRDGSGTYVRSFADDLAAASQR